MKIFAPLLCTALLLSCSGNDKTADKKDSATDSVAVNASSFKNVTNNAPEMYDTAFVRALSESQFANKYMLEKDRIIMDDTVKVVFTEDLALNKDYKLEGCRGDRCFVLKLKRISNTEISYVLDETVAGGQPYTLKGNARIGVGFILGSEMDESEGDDPMAYEAMEYHNYYGCDLYIRIGRTPDDGLHARIIKNCEDGSDNLSLEESPDLISK
jgi:hypothetical protein